MRRFGQQFSAGLALVGYVTALAGAMSLHQHEHVTVLAQEHAHSTADAHAHHCGHHHHGHAHGASNDSAPDGHHHHSPYESDDCSICQWLAEKPLVTVHIIVFEFIESFRDAGPPEILLPDTPSLSLPPSRGPPALS